MARARQEAGLTQDQLAERLGTTQRMMTHWEREPVALRSEQLAAVADTLGVTADYLLGRETRNEAMDRWDERNECLNEFLRYRDVSNRRFWMWWMRWSPNRVSAAS